MSEDNSNKSYTIPSRQELVKRIEACREELQQLKKLLKLAAAVEKAEEAKRSRPPLSDLRKKT